MLGRFFIFYICYIFCEDLVANFGILNKPRLPKISLILYSSVICLNLDDLDIAWDMEGGLRSSILYPIAFGLGAKCLTNYPPKYPPITYYQARD